MNKDILTKGELSKIGMRVEEINQTIEITWDDDVLSNLEAELDDIIITLDRSKYNLKRKHLKVLR